VTQDFPKPSLDQPADHRAVDQPALWHNHDYILLWSGQVISTLGTSASSLVYPLLILAMTNSPAAAGLGAAFGSVPYIIFSLPVGALMDRWDRKRVMILCDIGRGLTLASIPIAIFFHVLTIWQIYAAALIEGSLFVFFNIAEVAALPRVVGKQQLPAAAAQNEVSFGVAAIAGPSIGTILYQAVSQGAPFLADAVSYAVSVVSLFFIRIPFQQDRVLGRLDLRAEIVEGLHWLWRQPLIRFMAALVSGFTLLDAALPLILIVLAKQTGTQDAQIGLIFSIAGLGGIAGSLVGGHIQKRFRFGQVIVSMTWVPALLFPMYALRPEFPLLGIITAIYYFSIPIFNIVWFSYRLALIPDELQGRVNSTFRFIAWSTRPLGAALSGLLLQRLGAVPTVLVFSLLCGALALVTSLNVHVRNAPPLEQAEVT
jgi:predicted MFS family arabinose efflux permease